MASTIPNSGDPMKSKDQHETHEDFPHAKAGRIKFVTKILMDSKYGLMDDLNYTRGFPEHNDSSLSSENGLEMNMRDFSKNSAELSQPIATIPRSSRIKADRVRIYLDYYYSLLERSINIESAEHHHEGVEGIYNPLQIIRNRSLRKKYHELPPRELFIQNSPVIAIKQFSKKPKQKMPWYVNISERSSDLTWRTSHWDELVDPHGSLWFPRKSVSERSPGSKESRHHRPHRRRLKSANSGLGINSPYSANKVNSSSPEIGNFIKSTHSEGNLMKNLQVPTAKSVDRKTTYAEIEKARSDRSDRSDKSDRSDFLHAKKSKQWSKSPHSRQRSQNVEKLASPFQAAGKVSHPSKTPAHSRRSSSSLIPMGHTTMDASIDNSDQKYSLLGALPIQPIRKNSADQTEEEQIENIKEVSGNGEEMYADSTDAPAGSNDLSQTDEQLQKYWKNTRYLLSTLQILQHRRITHNIVRKKGVEKRDRLQYDQKMDDILLDTTEVLATYEKELNKALKKGNSLASKMLNDYSMRVETLISTSDRILSDINTTLTLKLKLFQEDADRFGSLRGMKSQRVTRVLYRILEYAIVLILWSIWLVVSIIRWIKFSFLLVFKIFIWMLW